MKSMEQNHKDITTSAIRELIEIVAKLRSPSEGCPWDLAQTHESLIPYILEEAYEVVDAIRNKDNKEIKEELGDLLLQVVLQAQIGNEQRLFNLEDIAKEISNKLIRRHPHVFENQKATTIDEVKNNWEKIKMLEKPYKTSLTPISDDLKEKVRSQPAIAGTMEISKKAAKCGFEWEDIESLWDKVHEEFSELKVALKNNDLSNAEEELGDLLFTIINVGRWYNLSPEEGLAGTNKRFIERFSYMESTLEGDFSGHPLNEIKKLWENAKDSIKQRKNTSQENSETFKGTLPDR